MPSRLASWQGPYSFFPFAGFESHGVGADGRAVQKHRHLESPCLPAGIHYRITDIPGFTCPYHYPGSQRLYYGSCWQGIVRPDHFYRNCPVAGICEADRYSTRLIPLKSYRIMYEPTGCDETIFTSNWFPIYQ